MTGKTTEHVFVGRDVQENHDVSTGKERAGAAKGNTRSARRAIFHYFVTPFDTEMGGISKSVRE
jgi:hypothetical protein